MWFQRQPVARQRSFPESDLHFFLSNKIPTMFVAKNRLSLRKKKLISGPNSLMDLGGSTVLPTWVLSLEEVFACKTQITDVTEAEGWLLHNSASRENCDVAVDPFSTFFKENVLKFIQKLFSVLLETIKPNPHRTKNGAISHSCWILSSSGPELKCLFSVIARIFEPKFLLRSFRGIRNNSVSCRVGRFQFGAFQFFDIFFGLS